VIRRDSYEQLLANKMQIRYVALVSGDRKFRITVVIKSPEDLWAVTSRRSGVIRLEQHEPHTSRQVICEEINRLEALAADLKIVSSPPFPLDQMLARAYPNAPILDEWRFALRPVTCLIGLSTGHPRLIGERRSIVTSEIFLISQELGWARSFSRWYRLGRRLDQMAGNC
jgi:hypothetical protein